MRVMDLFSGIGGFSLGLKWAGGFETTSFCEIDPYCQKVLAKHWPDVPIHGDITKRGFQEGEADVITAGFPCQDISFAGKGAGITGSRSGLWREVVRAIRVVRPRYAILENVAALLGRGLGRVLGDLAESGADVEWNSISASDAGAPHIRDRIWILAHANGERFPRRAQSRSSIAREQNAGKQFKGLLPANFRMALYKTSIRRMDDGLSRPMDGVINEATETRSIKTLPPVWKKVVQEAIQFGAFGGFGMLSKTEILRSSLCGCGTNRSFFNKQTDYGEQGAQTQEAILRELWGNRATTCSPSRQETNKQQTYKSSDSLRYLSQQDTCRADRIAGLGNAVVPQIPELIGRSLSRNGA